MGGLDKVLRMRNNEKKIEERIEDKGNVVER